MKIQELVDNTIKQHTKSIELFQWAIISSIASLFYSEYIKNMVKKEYPIDKVDVPKINTIKEYLNKDSDFIKYLSNNLIDKLCNHELIKKYINIPEFILFTEDKSEIMKYIFDLHIIPNIIKRIPETISMKFQLNNPAQQTFWESNELNIFNRLPINDDQYYYIIEECVLQFILYIDNIKKEEKIVDTESSFILLPYISILTINHENAICPIMINNNIIEKSSVFSLLSFVTSTTIELLNYDNYIIKTNRNNKLRITTLL
jgi:hypothetical protein